MKVVLNKMKIRVCSSSSWSWQCVLQREMAWLPAPSACMWSEHVAACPVLRPLAWHQRHPVLEHRVLLFVLRVVRACLGWYPRHQRGHTLRRLASCVTGAACNWFQSGRVTTVMCCPSRAPKQGSGSRRAPRRPTRRPSCSACRGGGRWTRRRRRCARRRSPPPTSRTSGPRTSTSPASPTAAPCPDWAPPRGAARARAPLLCRAAAWGGLHPQCTPWPAPWGGRSR